VGGEGDDLLYAGSENDSLDGESGSDQLYGEAGIDSLTGRLGNDNLDGGDGNDVLLGGAGNDTLVGNLGQDLLTGGLGNDRFRYSSDKPFKLSNFGNDTIRDFVSGRDKFVLDRTAFTALSPRTRRSAARSSTLRPEQFAIVERDGLAAASKARIVYSANTGKLFYNPNRGGTGLGNGGQFATLSGAPSLEAGDFLIT
jgi:Ca2+-binding RTX toxin-like protein